MNVRICKKCGETKPQTHEYFNQLSSGYWRGTCKVCMAANTRAHYLADPQKVMDRVERYKAQKLAAGGTYSDTDIDAIRVLLKDCCAYCGVPLNGGGEIDHILPVSQGGDSSPNNLTLACRTCNRDKHGKSAEEYIQWRRRLGLPIRKLE